MNNPFEIIESRLSIIEKLLLDFTHPLTPTQIQRTQLLTEDEVPQDVDEISLLTGFSKPTIYGYCQKNKIPYHKKNGRLFFFKSEIIEWIKEGKQKTLKEIHSNTDDFLTNKNKRLK